MKILIADDDPISNQLLTLHLTNWGYEVTCATNGREACNLLELKDAPKLVILDWMMPEMSGLEVCQYIRKLQDNPYFYILLLTRKTQKEDMILGLEVGADDYITKPFDWMELEARLKTGVRIINLHQALSHSLAQLQETEQHRQHFITALTHDLRTPLAAEKMALGVLQKEQTGMSLKSQEIFDSLIKNNQDLLQLVNQLIETYQYEEGKIHVNPEPMDLYPLVEECFTALYPLAESKNIQLTNHIPPGSFTVQGDTVQLIRVFKNLVSNAITNIPSHKHVNIYAANKGAFIEVSIQDNGPGIHPNLLPYIFERYYTGNKKLGGIGAGLGLSICKTIINLHDGELNVVSTLNQGTNFYFTLPASFCKAPTSL